MAKKQVTSIDSAANPKKGTKGRKDEQTANVNVHANINENDLGSRYSTNDLSGEALAALQANLGLDAILDTSNPFNINTNEAGILQNLQNATSDAYEAERSGINTDMARKQRESDAAFSKQSRDTGAAYNKQERDTEANFTRQGRETQSSYDTKKRESEAAFDKQKRESEQAYNRGEDSNYRNTQNAIDQMRRNLIKSTSSGANVGAANATALQALLGLGQQNAATTTQGMQNVQNIAGERSRALQNIGAERTAAINDIAANMNDALNNIGATRSEAIANIAQDQSTASQGISAETADLLNDLLTRETAARTQNVVDATNTANAAKQTQGQLATDQYSALTGAQGTRAASAAEAVGTLGSALDTNASNERMNSATNRTNVSVAAIPNRSVSNNTNRSYEEAITRNINQNTNVNKNK